MPAPSPETDRIVQALPEELAWDGPPDETKLADLPGHPAVLLFLDAHQRPVQLLTTQALKRLALSRLRQPDEPARGRADLTAVVRRIRWRTVHCPFENRWWYTGLARQLYPSEYRELMPFGPAWFLHVDWRRQPPELRISDRVYEQDGAFLGPWNSRRACQSALDGLRDLFELCRYPEQVRKAPHGQPCAYAEMGRCDAPCDGSVTLDDYAERCRTAWRFAGGEITPWIDDAQQRMRSAAVAQEFEHAAQIKQQIEFAEKWRAQWQVHVRDAAKWHELFALPVTRRKAWIAFMFRAGFIEQGPTVTDRKAASAIGAWATERNATPLPDITPTTRKEQAWLYSHLLSNRESDRAIIVRMGEHVDAPRIAEQIQQRIDAVRKAAD